MKTIPVKTTLVKNNFPLKEIETVHSFNLSITGECNKETTEMLERKSRILFLRAIQTPSTTEIGKHNIKFNGEIWAIELFSYNKSWGGKAFRMSAKDIRIRKRLATEEKKIAQEKYWWRHDLNRKSLKY